MIVALLLAAALCPHPHRSDSVIALFKRLNPAPEFIETLKPDEEGSCATYRKVRNKRTGKVRTVLYRKDGACAVDHRCALAACGVDALRNLQWLDALMNLRKSADPSLCTPDLVDPLELWRFESQERK